MGTYADLKARVADELNKKNLTSQIASAVSRAIEFYAIDRFEFNENTKTALTVANDQYVTYPSGLRLKDELFLQVSGNSYVLKREDFDTIEYWHGIVNTIGQPTSYAERDGRFRLYPTPQKEYTLTVTGIYDEDALVEEADTNGFTSGMFEDLICQRAKYTIARDITYDAEVMNNADMAIKEILRRIRRESNAKTSNDRIEAGW